MKIFVVDICKKGAPDFYIKPETSQIRNNEPLYIPLFCEELRYETAFAVKINRVTKSINKNFASRCWNELGIVTNFWSEDVIRLMREKGNNLDIARSFDRSFALPNDFASVEILHNDCNISAKMFVNESEILTLEWNDIKDEIDDVISYISSYVTLKIGDVIMLKNSCRDSFRANINDKIELKLNDETVVETLIK